MVETPTGRPAAPGWEDGHEATAIQIDADSCGMACVAMVVHRVRGIRLLESSLRSYSQCFYQGPKVENSTGYDAKKGTEPFNLAIMLKKMAIPCEFRDNGRALTVLPGASVKKPIIGTVNWDVDPMDRRRRSQCGLTFRRDRLV